MFETTKIVIKNNKRDFLSKINESPVLYFFFSLIMLFSIIMFSFLTYYFQTVDIGLDINLEEVFLMVFFVFMAKAGVDFFKNYVKPGEVTYALSTQVEHKKTISEIFYAVFLSNLFVWFLLSTLFIFFLFLLQIDIAYPFEYLYFSIGVITSIIIGSTIAINFFSTNGLRLLPSAVLLAFFFYSQNPLFILFISPLALVHLFWSLKHAISSYQNIRRKLRINERSQVKIRNRIKALFYKETTILWRDKMFFSFIFTSSITGVGTGYLYRYGTELLIPEALRDIYADFLPALFIFVGVLIVVIYTSVFPSLNLFLNEEKTMWIIRHIPIYNKTLILGKTTTLLLCFVTAIPFIFYLSIFLGFDQVLFVTWLLMFSFIASAIISIPLGVKYVGKKSDVMLLYSVTMILFVVISPVAVFGAIIYNTVFYWGAILLATLLVELVVLYVSLKISEEIIRLKYPLKQ
jgi:hypothetical protein